MQDEDPQVRGAAVATLTDQALLAKVGGESSWPDVWSTAVGKITDQTLVRSLAQRASRAAIREASVRRITDDRFLVQRLSVERSAAVRAALIETLHERNSLHTIALTAYHREDRNQALERLRLAFKDPSRDVAAEHAALAARVNALAAETDTGKVVKLALEGEFDVVCNAAAQRLSDPAALEQVALRSRDREVLKILLPKLLDRTVLTRVAAASADPAMRLAAAQKVGAKSWRGIFNAATARGATAQMLGDAISAVSLFPRVQAEAQQAVQQACLNLIRRGDESRIPEMADLLEGYGDEMLAEDYLNCGQPDLEVAGQQWANRQGYAVDRGRGSHRATWGSGR